MVHISGVQTVLFCVTVLHIGVCRSYDSSSSCSPGGGRAGRARTLRGIPCDLTRHSYCHLPGAAYPWHAVRRFVHENQGLMRRMYGDQRHIAVLQAEIDDNSFGFEVTDEDRWSANARYSRQDFVRKPTDRKLLHLKLSNEVYTVPHFRPTTHAPINRGEENDQEIKSENDEDNSIVKNPQILHNIQPIQIGIEDALKPNKESNNIYNSSNNDIQSVLPEKIEENVTVASTPLSVDNETTTEYDIVSEPTTEDIPEDPHLQDDNGNSAENDGNIEDDLSDSEEDTEGTTDHATVTESTKQDETNVKKDITISEKIASIYKNSAASQTEEASGTQLFQDAAAQESAPQIMKLRGVNACPVKEEVVAPFWANNTRGEVLALLNLYPFEQYVHWEKCSHEHKQMFCRDGCRCEQQYRLHRLLAYDPHNECRGIFSDWFRFPSCCVCKCYDMPVEFRVTSRSPRAGEPRDHMSSHWNEEVEDIVKRELYRHATDRWYNPIDG